MVAVAEDLPFNDHCFTHVYSVEAAQHFESFSAFATEAFRVLVPGGRLGLTTMFASNHAALTPSVARSKPNSSRLCRF
ncbi:MAG: class I SAM-dependent methyltransferase, partial [Proteobacteria bacterium]|nr:class I SAM-dependent methyltransferase [Pseudomonadota bacterium]